MLKVQRKSFPLKLKLLRLESGKSQEILASELGISRSCLANYETGKRSPDRETLSKIAALFEVEEAFFFDKPFLKGSPMQERLEEAMKKMPEPKEGDEVLDVSKLSLAGQFCMHQFYNLLLATEDDDPFSPRENPLG